MNYEEALDKAEKVKMYLAPFCRRIEIAGSIRRKKQNEIKDIEIVAIPIFDFGVDVFGNARKQTDPNQDLLSIRVHQLLSDGSFAHGDPDKAGKRAPCGHKYYRLKYDENNLDLFAVIPPAEWGTVFLIRTGDADFSHKFVTRLWKFGLRSVEGHIEDSTNKIIPTPEEKDAFELCHMNFILPELRSAEVFKGFP